MKHPRHVMAEPDLSLFSVDSCGTLHAVEGRALHPEAPDISQFPYGAVVLPVADRDGNVVIVFTQPGTTARNDVLLIEKPVGLAVRGRTHEEMEDGRPEHRRRARVRVAMEPLVWDISNLPGSATIVRLGVGMGAGERLSPKVRELLATVCYTIRAGDQPGWFEFGDHAFPCPAFRHGFPDLATREQGGAGIRGASCLAVGLQRRIRPSRFHPHRKRPLEPGERVICELHVGTFTKEGSFSAAARHLTYLRKKGITTLQLMPVDISSGPPGWTYDQTRTGAVDSQQYGGADGLIDFVEQAHRKGLEVIIDKQYNHQGPEQDSRSEIIPGMFARETKWGPGLSGSEALHYPQIMKLMGEEMAYWVSQFGIDGFRFDATNRLPWEVHHRLADYGRQAEYVTGKPLYLLSEYAECEEPKGERVPTGHQYTDETGRLVMKMLGLSRASHVDQLPIDDGSLLRPMLKSARRGWWYPDVPGPKGGLHGGERATTLLWHHDWIGNRFGGERISQLINFPMFKTLSVWQALGQWTPFFFMGTERYAKTPWYYFTGHLDSSAKNHTSAFYQTNDGIPVLAGGRFHEFAPEARDAGLSEALAFSGDGTVASIDWEVFRAQRDRLGRPYMDHARRETFEASKLDWNHPDAQQQVVERLFERVLRARQDPRLKEEDPSHTQYKAWENNERVFLMRRRAPDGRELMAFFNLSDEAVSVRISTENIELRGYGRGYIVALDDSRPEEEWESAGRYSLWLDTNANEYGGASLVRERRFQIMGMHYRDIELACTTAIVFSRQPRSPGHQ
jgi:hypothetical protein